MESKRHSSFDEASATHSPAVTSGTPARSTETAPIEAAAPAPVDAAPEEPATASFPTTPPDIAATTRSPTQDSFPLVSMASVPTDRAARYGKQLVTHMAHKVTGAWDEETTSGYLLFDREGPVLGRFDVIASASDLRLELRTTPERAEHLEHVAGIHLARFGARDSLAISWERTDGSEGTTQGPLTPEEVEAHTRAKKAAREAAQEAGHAASGHATE